MGKNVMTFLVLGMKIICSLTRIVACFTKGDFLLGVLKQILQDRADVYLVLMSATINSELFSKYFDAPTITV